MKPHLAAVLGCVWALGPACAFAQVGVRPSIMADVPTTLGQITTRDLAQVRPLKPPVELQAAAGKKDLDLQGDGRSLAEQVAKVFGLSALFDPQYQPVARQRLQVNQVDYRGALRALDAATDSFVIAFDPHRIFVARDTSQKRQEFEPMVSVVVPIPEPVTVQEAQAVANSVRSVMDIRRMIVDTEKHMVLIRDFAAKVRPAQVLIKNLMRPRPQVVIEMELMSTTEQSSVHYGLSLPASFPLIDFGKVSPSIAATPIPSGPTGFLGLGGGKSFIGIGITDAAWFATLSKSFANTLQHSEQTASDGQSAEIKLGSKYPVISSTYIGNTSSSSQVFTPPPTVNFEDLGLVVKFTPHIHGADGVSLDIDASFKLLSGTTANGLPVIEDRHYTGSVGLRDGQWAVLAGLMSASEARTVTGLAGVSDIPLIGRLLRENQTDKSRDETLLVIKPRITIAPASAEAARLMYVGTETRPNEPL